jgi:hypothetical protein
VGRVWPRRPEAGGGKAGHVQADLGDDDLRGARGDAGDFVEPRDDRQRRSAGVGVGAVGVVGWRGRGELRDEFVDPNGEPVDLPGQCVVVVQQHTGQLGVVLIEASGQGLDQRNMFCPHPAQRQADEHLRVAFSGDQRLDHRAPGFAHDVRGHGGQLDQGVLEQFLQSLRVPGSVPDQIHPQPGVVAQHADLGGWNERGSQHASFGEFRQPNRVKFVGFRSARDVFHVVRVDQPYRHPSGFE